MSSLADGRRLLFHHVAPQRRALWRLAAWSALEGGPAFVSGLLIATAIDRGFLAGRPLAGVGWLAVLAAVYVVAALATRQAYPWLAATVEPMRDSLVTALVTATLRRAVGGEEADGASVAQTTVQVESVRGLFSALLRTVRQLLTAGLAAIGGLLLLSPLLALVVGACVLLAVAVFVWLLRVLITRARTVVLREERITACAAPVVNGVRDVVVAAAEGRVAREVGVVIDAEADASRALARAEALRLPLVTLGAHLPLLALLLLSPWLLANGHLTVGQVVGGVFYLISGLLPAMQILVNAGGMIIVNLGVVLGRMAEVCAEGPRPAATAPGRFPERHDLALRDVTFAYSPHAEPVVRDLTLDVAEGRHLAVVGPSGVGKSTLANLLARLVVPQAGELRLGGVPLPEVDEPALRRMVALIPQEAYVFAGTVRDNLRYLCPRATEDELGNAVDAVGLEELAARLGGLDGEITPAALSPGEGQLIALARVYLAPARLVVLDEATCHLDPVAEARAEQAFADRDGTLVVIAHRISSAMRAEQILVMDGADPLLGTHDELLVRSPLYAELVGHWADGSGAATGGPGRSGLVASGVEFGYGPHGARVLHDVDLTVAPGEHLAVTGRSGAGKSTLAALLAGLLTPRRGTVTLDGMPLAPGMARSRVRVVPQQGYVLTGTLRTNLTHLAADADDERIVAAAEALGAAELLGDGLDAQADALSAGGRQLVALTRAYLSEAEVVVLDEATCHLDPPVEAQVERAFRERGSTLIVVTPRLSSATRADRVLVLDEEGPVRTPVASEVPPEADDRVPTPVGAGALARLRPWRHR